MFGRIARIDILLTFLNDNYHIGNIFLFILLDAVKESTLRKRLVDIEIDDERDG